MRSPLLRTALAVSTAAIATVAMLAATAVSASADEGFEIQMRGFDEYPSSGDGLDWPVTVANNTDSALEKPVFSLSLFEKEDDLSALALDLGDSGCTKKDTDTGVNVTCELAELPAESKVTFDFTLSLREGADRVNHGLSYVQAQLRQPTSEDNPTFAEKMVTLDASLPLDDDGRVIDVKAPKKVGSDQVYGDDNAKGEELSFTVVNNDYDTGTLVHANLVIDVDKKTGVMPATKLDGCDYSNDRSRLSCPVEGLGAKDERAYTFTLWAKNADAWKKAKPGKVNIDVVVPHGDHEDTWAHTDSRIKLVEADGDGTLPVTGASMSTPIAVGAAALLLGVVALVVTRRRKTSREVTSG